MNWAYTLIKGHIWNFNLLHGRNLIWTWCVRIGWPIMAIQWLAHGQQSNGPFISSQYFVAGCNFFLTFHIFFHLTAPSLFWCCFILTHTYSKWTLNAMQVVCNQNINKIWTYLNAVHQKHRWEMMLLLVLEAFTFHRLHIYSKCNAMNFSTDECLYARIQEHRNKVEKILVLTTNEKGMKLTKNHMYQKLRTELLHLHSMCGLVWTRQNERESERQAAERDRQNQEMGKWSACVLCVKRH